MYGIKTAFLAIVSSCGIIVSGGVRLKGKPKLNVRWRLLLRTKIYNMYSKNKLSFVCE